jgi:hypothetical protein
MNLIHEGPPRHEQTVEKASKRVYHGEPASPVTTVMIGEQSGFGGFWLPFSREATKVRI